MTLTGVDQYDAFAQKLACLVADDRMDKAGALAQRYWKEPFSGRYFHLFADIDHPNEFTEKDFVAVSMLAVDIPPHVAIYLRSDEGRGRVGELLSAIPLDVDIWDAGPLLEPDREAWQLWDLLGTAAWPAPRAGNQMGKTKKSKLMAVKRPRLVPIYDSVLEALLPPVTSYWDAFAHALRDEKLRLALSIAANTGAPDGATLLRKLDALLWMIGKQTDW